MASGNWADSINQIFEEEGSVHRKTVILSKVKSTKPVKKDVSHGFEIDNEKPKEKKPATEPAKDPAASKERRLQKKRKFEVFKTLRVQPDIRDRNRELTLKKVATRGVVQLFNAVQSQQRTLKKDVAAEKIDSKREDILNNINKKNFLNVLMGSAKSVLIDNPVKKEKKDSDDSDDDDEKSVSAPPSKKPAKESTWNVLKDNFVGAPAKKGSAWNEDSDEEDQQQMDDD